MAGCVSKDGPTATAVRGGAAQTIASNVSPAYLVTDISPALMQVANRATVDQALRFSGMARGVGPDVSIGVGDLVSVTIFESEAGGLFIPKEAGSREGNFIQVPNQQVDASGNISIPYIPGPVRVAGRTTRAVGALIAERLKNRAIEPQAVVSVVDRRGNDVSVLGEVNTANRFPLDPGGITLLNAIARAGGPKFPAYQTTVSIQRGGVIQRAWLSTVVREPSQNVPLRPGDVVYLSQEPRIFMTLGATPSPGAVGGVNNRRFPFENDTMTLAEAVAKSGGLDPSRADPKAVFLFRLEPKSALISSGVDISRFPGDLVPTVYKTDMSKAGGLFVANSFLIRDKDILFVGEDQSVELNRFLNNLSAVTGNAANVAGAAVDGRAVIQQRY